MHDDGSTARRFIEWSIYDNLSRKAMINEYQELRRGQNFEDSFLDFLKEKLDIEG